MEGDQPHSSLRTSIHPCNPKRRHYSLFTAKHQHGIFPVLSFYMNKMIVIGRKKLEQFFSLPSFLPHMAQATHFAFGTSSWYRVLSDTPGTSLSSVLSGQPQERCLSPEHLRHWMLWSTEDTETLKHLFFFFFKKTKTNQNTWML